MDKQDMICGYKLEELVAIANLLQQNPMLLEDLKEGYKFGYEQGYKHAIEEVNEAVKKEINRIVLKDVPISVCDNAETLPIPKIKFEPMKMPDESIKDKCARLYMQKVVQPKMKVFMKTEKDNG